ncbi:hypothetical protein [Paenibacillus daejeonensis]|uniref:hypothetical protein n=1 Tax=Paenibacillus daejeonensis TaxID=135193 RepID=UPI0003663E88|nr:hypothetical protein [Paenibacillus daejeonensis]
METEKRNVLDGVKTTMKGVDQQQVLRLFKNPLESVRLTEREWIYGVLGVASAFVGYLIWSLMIASRVNGFFGGFLGMGGLGGMTRSATWPIFGRLFLIGLLSTAVLLAAIWLAAWWRSGTKPELKLFAIRIGGTFYIGAAGFLLAALFTLMSLGLGMLLLSITLLSLLLLSVQAGAEAGAVPRHALASYLILSVTSYLVLITLIIQIIF